MKSAPAPGSTPTAPAAPEPTADERIAAALPDHRWTLLGMARRMETPEITADDLAQEGYIAMWRALDKFQSGNLAGYLVTAARNRMVSVASGSNRQLGNESRVPQQGRTVSADQLREDLDWDVAVEDAAENVELAYHYGQIHRALAELPEKQRAAVVARFWHGERDRDIVAALHLGNSWWSRTQARLAESLAHLADAV